MLQFYWCSNIGFSLGDACHSQVQAPRPLSLPHFPSENWGGGIANIRIIRLQCQVRIDVDPRIPQGCEIGSGISSPFSNKKAPILYVYNKIYKKYKTLLYKKMTSTPHRNIHTNYHGLHQWKTLIHQRPRTKTLQQHFTTYLFRQTMYSSTDSTHM